MSPGASGQKLTLMPLKQLSSEKILWTHQNKKLERRRDSIIVVEMVNYIKAGGRVNRKGRPNVRDFNAFIIELDVGRVNRAERNEYWAQVTVND